MLARTLRCRECGSHNHSGTEFCQKCGGVMYKRRELQQDRYTDILFLRVF